MMTPRSSRPGEESASSPGRSYFRLSGVPLYPKDRARVQTPRPFPSSPLWPPGSLRRWLAPLETRWSVLLACRPATAGSPGYPFAAIEGSRRGLHWSRQSGTLPRRH